MNQIIRKASAHWRVEATGSSRTATIESGVIRQAGVTSGLPLESNLETDPPELIAAAHASSLSLALSNEPAAIDLTGGEIITTAMLTLERLAAGWTIVKSICTSWQAFPA